jgi:hypothetical protein
MVWLVGWDGAPVITTGSACGEARQDLPQERVSEWAIARVLEGGDFPLAVTRDGHERLNGLG